MTIEVITACIVAYIAWQQYRIEHNKLRLAFYDRRLKVFESFHELFISILETGDVSDEAWAKYKNGCPTHKFELVNIKGLM